MPIIQPYALPESLQQEYDALRTQPTSLEPLIRQQRINRLLHQMKQGYYEYLSTVLFPQEAYRWGLFRVSYPSFNLYQSTELFVYLSTSHSLSDGSRRSAWQHHWLNLEGPVTYAALQTREGLPFFTQSVGRNPTPYLPILDEQQRYVVAVKAFRQYSTYSNELKNVLQTNLDFKIPQTNKDILLTEVMYADYQSSLQDEPFDCARMIGLAAEIRDSLSFEITQNLANKSMILAELAEFERIHHHNLAVVEAMIATRDAENHLKLSRNITRALLIVSAIGLVVAALALGLIYFQVIAVAIATSHYLLGLLAASALGYGLAMARFVCFHNSQANGNLPPLEVLDKLPLEDSLRENLHALRLSF